MTESKDIMDVVKKWQEKLGLSDWDITATFNSQEHLNGQAKTRIYDTSQIAKMYLLSPEDRQSSDPNDSDVEQDIVHELIHVRLWAIDPKEIEGTMHVLREQAIEWIARALLKTERQFKGLCVAQEKEQV